MADQIYYSLFTEQGLELLTEAIQNGTKLGITSMAFGDGGGELPIPDASFRGLVNEVYRTQLNSLAPDPNNKNWLRAEAIIASAIGGFNIRELGLYAGDILVAYSNYPATYKPNPADGTARIMTFRMILQIDNTANFELRIDADIVMATIRAVEEAKQEANQYSELLSKQRILHVDSIEDLLSITNMASNDTAYVKSFYKPQYGLSNPFSGGHGTFVYDEMQSGINNGATIFNGWIRQIVDKTYTPQMAGGKDTIALNKLLSVIPEYSTIYLENGEYDFSGTEIRKNGIRILGESKDGVIIKLKADPVSGVFFRCGKRGPSSDYRSDNLPVYNGTLNYWDVNHYSPAVPDYPRYKNIRVDNVTFLLSDENGAGSSTGIDFYRIDGGGLDAKIKWTSSFNFGNALRIHYCKDLDIPNLEIDDNENSTYSVLYYWSYGLNGGIWKIGKGNLLSIDFKHSVNGYIRYLEAYGRGILGYTAVNFGYGGIGNVVDKLIAKNGNVTIKSSVEFDLQRDVTIRDLHIDNPNHEGLTFIHAQNVRVEKYYIRAKSPLLFTTAAFMTFSDTTNIVPAKSSAEFIYDGNYFSTTTESGIIKYYEKRPFPILKDGFFGKGTLLATPGATRVILTNVAGGITDTMASNGKVFRFEDGYISSRGFNESLRVSFEFENSAPFSLDNIDFGDMSLKTESEDLTGFVAAAQFTTALDKCKGTLKTYINMKSLMFLWMFDSDIKLETNRFLNVASEYVIEMNSMVRSILRGKWMASGRVVNFKGGSTVAYTDGYDDHKFNCTILRPSGATASPPFLTNFTTRTETWKPLQLENVQVYSEDWTSSLVDNAVIKHNASIPLGVTDAVGGGYVSKNCFFDRNIPFRRYFTASSADSAPSYTPNFVGEMAQNGTTDTWWKAINLSTWSKV